MPLIVYYTSALTSLSDSVSYITFLFSEWRIEVATFRRSSAGFQRGWSRPAYGSMKSTTHISARELSDTTENRI